MIFGTGKNSASVFHRSRTQVRRLYVGGLSATDILCKNVTNIWNTHYKL